MSSIPRDADPLAFLDSLKLTAAGITARKHLGALAQCDPFRKARSLGIDVKALEAACTAWNASHPCGPKYDFRRSLAAEIENQELIARDSERRHTAVLDFRGAR